MIKRLFDLTFASIGLFLGAPIFSALALLIKLEDGGPVFYRGIRVGRYGRPFKIFKLRTMVINAEEFGGPSTADDDPRITRTGMLIRKFKLDEVPQLINVFKGEMSLVGPRPEVQHYVDMFTEEEKEILTVRPGITDWASLWNSDEGSILAGSPDPERTYMEEIRPTKLRLQLKYVRERSFMVDLGIILRTIATVISKS